MRPLWAFSLIDIDGPWCWTLLTPVLHKQVLERLKSLETMTWSQIVGKQNHFITSDGLSPQAWKRLVEIGQDDSVDILFSIRVTGERRVWGIRKEHVLYLLWWDPHHEVYPSRKK